MIEWHHGKYVYFKRIKEEEEYEEINGRLIRFGGGVVTQSV